MDEFMEKEMAETIKVEVMRRLELISVEIKRR